MAPTLALLLVAAATAAPAPAGAPVEVWGTYEAALDGPRDGNPFTEVELFADLTNGDRRQSVRGFYDGQGKYRFRFMPDRPGAWRWVTRSNRPALAGRRGGFQAVAARAPNHGPVRVRDRFHFAYADGKPYFPFGTTIYAFVHQALPLQEQTLATLARAPFNKLRLCLFPKWYDYNRVEPPLYPFERAAGGAAGFDTSRPNPAFYRLLEQRLRQLRDLGIEADVILFHPYDEGHWGFDRMSREVNERTLRYVIARLGAFRNVWWSMANEWDFVKNRPVAEWTALFDVIAAEDSGRHLASIHNGVKFFDHKHPAITHASIQSPDVGRLRAWRDEYGKPAVDDEAMYEGDIEHAWGNISGRELVHRHWVGFLRGGYVGHGETFLAPDDVLWWARGGVLRGESPPRLAFLRKIVESGGGALEPAPDRWPFGPTMPAARLGRSFLIYLGAHQPRLLTSAMVERLARDDATLKDARWRFEVIDPWEMTVTPLPGEHQGKYRLSLPGKPQLVLRATPVPSATALGR